MAPRKLPPLPLPEGITSSFVTSPASPLRFHILSAGSPSDPLIILLHGFPELAFSWRKVMLPLASHGYHVVAVDQRGYGRTTGWDTSPFPHVDLTQFAMTNLVHDILVVIAALGYETVHCVVGHDFGSVSASMCALMRPDVFKSVVMMSHPFTPPSPLPLNTNSSDFKPPAKPSDITESLTTLPSPKKHYKLYNASSSAASDYAHPPQSLPTFLRGYFHLKSGLWPPNSRAHPLPSFTAENLVQMPGYYIMPLHSTMPAVVASLMSDQDASLTLPWLSAADLAVYVDEWTRTGFQGGLNWYRCATDPARMRDVEVFAGKKIKVPSTFISGERDWGNWQVPGALEGMEGFCKEFRGVVFVEGAGHWVQQEKAERVVEEVLRFSKGVER
ncbi:alpha/beta-hydrolase [Aulographum hederae CBS 113979]|uniref:Alpha/beta-hydrolase n=1 Tax=Aulographum hederae CBS 113979 TaxID=1176131 RepID=A0A6G1H6Q2_9PEZI|nr:alpha/beta-hydrolase [Aulographum hederae CBS 113979]